jgi:hypothetical protein
LADFMPFEICQACVNAVALGEFQKIASAFGFPFVVTRHTEYLDFPRIVRAPGESWRIVDKRDMLY